MTDEQTKTTCIKMEKMSAFKIIFSLCLFFLCQDVSSQETAINLQYIAVPVQFSRLGGFNSSSFEQVIGSSLQTDFHKLATSPIINLSVGSLSSNCQSDISYLNKTLYSQNKTLAIQYLDAASKIPPGVLDGKWNWVGDYQECGSIQTVQNGDTKFKGKYFIGAIYVNGKPALGVYPILFGFCLPNTCNATDGSILFNSALKLLEVELISRGIILDLSALVMEDEPTKWDRGVIVTIVISALLVGLVLIGTVIDVTLNVFKREKTEAANFMDVDNPTYGLPGEPSERTGLLTGEIFSESIQDGRCASLKDYVVEACITFSFLNNAKKLFSTQTSQGPLACLNGLRVLSMWWVILGHTYVFGIMVLDNSVTALDTVTNKTSYRPIVNGTFSVDSFFFLSGLLVAYLSIKQIQDKGKFGVKGWIYFFLHRYWRLTPLYAFVLLIYTNMLPFAISGPLMFYKAYLQTGLDTCKTYWWTNLLYINNFYPYYGNLATTCMDWGWYLANDMQFYLFISPVVILIYSLRDMLGRRLTQVLNISYMSFLIVACILIRALLTFYYGAHGLQGVPTKHVDEPWGKNGLLYQRPYARWSVYVVGLLTGCFLAVRHLRITFNKSFSVVGWLIIIPTGLTLVYTDASAKMTLLSSVFYASLSRTVWGVCLAWVVLACVSGHGGPVKQILSWQIWAPLGRLTYAAYLIHPIVLFSMYLSRETPLHFTDLTMVYMFIAALVLSYAMAFIVSLVVEAPMLQLEKFVIRVLKKSDD